MSAVPGHPAPSLLWCFLFTVCAGVQCRKGRPCFPSPCRRKQCHRWRGGTEEAWEAWSTAGKVGVLRGLLVVAGAAGAALPARVAQMSDAGATRPPARWQCLPRRSPALAPLSTTFVSSNSTLSRRLTPHTVAAQAAAPGGACHSEGAACTAAARCQAQARLAVEASWHARRRAARAGSEASCLLRAHPLHHLTPLPF